MQEREREREAAELQSEEEVGWLWLAEEGEVAITTVSQFNLRKNERTDELE